MRRRISIRGCVRPSVPSYFRRWKERILGASFAVYPALFSFFSFLSLPHFLLPLLLISSLRSFCPSIFPDEGSLSPSLPLLLPLLFLAPSMVLTRPHLFFFPHRFPRYSHFFAYCRSMWKSLFLFRCDLVSLFQGLSVRPNWIFETWAFWVVFKQKSRRDMELCH